MSMVYARIFTFNVDFICTYDMCSSIHHSRHIKNFTFNNYSKKALSLYKQTPIMIFGGTL